MFRWAVLPVFMMLVSLSGWSAQEQIVFKDLHGQTHRLDDYRGKWLIINYWATWCPPCLDEIPELAAFHDKFSKSKAVVLGVNFEEPDPDYLKKFVEEYFISYPILMADLDRPTPFGRLLGLPTTFIVSPQGVLVDTKIGGVTQDYLESVIMGTRQQVTDVRR